jgi:hypothetical protein
MDEEGGRGWEKLAPEELTKLRQAEEAQSFGIRTGLIEGDEPGESRERFDL